MTMNLLVLKQWFLQRTTRERGLLLLIGWAFLYALFYFSLLSPLSQQEKNLADETTTLIQQIKNWTTKIASLQQISGTPLYKQWLVQHQLFQQLQSQYNHLLQSSNANQWQDVIKTVLSSQPHVTVVQVKNFPEAVYNPTPLASPTLTIYQKKIFLVIFSNYFDTIAYLERLEKLLPNIHWDRLNYQVAHYPLAKVEMEFSIVYEKPH